MSDKAPLLFTFDTKGIEEIYVDCEDQLTMAFTLMRSFFEEENTNKHKEM